MNRSRVDELLAEEGDTEAWWRMREREWAGVKPADSETFVVVCDRCGHELDDDNTCAHCGTCYGCG